jgi:2-polyprenyl-6-methoxyphenol hydroxylase-like FAD-dependent oxidoreductase
MRSAYPTFHRVRGSMRRRTQEGAAPRHSRAGYPADQLLHGRMALLGSAAHPMSPTSARRLRRVQHTVVLAAAVAAAEPTSQLR